MITELRPYKEYRSTGVSWIGEVPDHWGMERAKWLYQKMARPVRDADEIVTCFRDGIVTLRKNRRLDGFTNSLKEIGYQGVRRGDLVIHAMDAFAGAVGVSDSDGKSTPVYSVCTARMELDNRYYAYLVREMARSQWIMCLARGIRERSTDFRFQAFGAQTVPLPPVEEQRAIADYLDANAAKVRRFIRNRRRQIEVLKEQKQAIIKQAMTRGLDNSIPLEPTETDWLGSIPRHWRVKRLKYLADICTGGRDTVDRKDDGAYPFFVRSQKPERIDTYSFDGEAVLTAGDGAGVAKVFHYVNGKFDYHQRVYKFSGFKEIAGRFFYYYFGSTLRYEAFRETAKSTVDSLRLPMLKNFPVVVPPPEEQEKIVAWIENEVDVFDKSILRAAKEIEIIREYRTRLIADVVTGKVDVRHLAPPPGSEDLQEAADELEPLDDAAGELEDEALAGEVAHADD